MDSAGLALALALNGIRPTVATRPKTELLQAATAERSEAACCSQPVGQRRRALAIASSFVDERPVWASCSAPPRSITQTFTLDAWGGELRASTLFVDALGYEFEDVPRVGRDSRNVKRDWR